MTCLRRRSAGRGRGHDPRGSSAVVRNGVVHIEESPEPPFIPSGGIKDAHLILVGIDAHVRCVLLADHENANDSARPILVAVPSALAARKGDHLALRQIRPTVGSAEGKLAVQNDEHLLALKVVVEDHSLAGSKFIESHSEVVTTCLLSESRTPPLSPGLEVRAIDVGHGPIVPLA